ncbi:hypothetical protein L596_019975 [Steinernema carpocapsae]|uniref:Uncharacterized protein n=1 Tax=Steinernema carpocapsae TaxID=34508 RepID=A0A4U5MSZ6_STECR|nr:hypothetical protein L596_019975 [Steinernema carpocapsae]
MLILLLEADTTTKPVMTLSANRIILRQMKSMLAVATPSIGGGKDYERSWNTLKDEPTTPQSALRWPHSIREMENWREVMGNLRHTTEEPVRNVLDRELGSLLATQMGLPTTIDAILGVMEMERDGNISVHLTSVEEKLMTTRADGNSSSSNPRKRHDSGN